MHQSPPETSSTSLSSACARASRGRQRVERVGLRVVADVCGARGAAASAAREPRPEPELVRNIRFSERFIRPTAPCAAMRDSRGGHRTRPCRRERRQRDFAPSVETECGAQPSAKTQAARTPGRSNEAQHRPNTHDARGQPAARRPRCSICSIRKENGEAYDAGRVRRRDGRGRERRRAQAGRDRHRHRERRRDEQGRLRHLHQGSAVGLRRPLPAPAASRPRAASRVARSAGAHARQADVQARGLRRPRGARRPRGDAEGRREPARRRHRASRATTRS